VTEAVYDGLVSLPLYPAMDDDDVEDVIEAVRRIHEYASPS
jgi:dTDP-4-amino-4,6-dideoxygalactose transaminase